MKFHFEPNLDYQLQAIEAVCDLFRGQEVCHTEFTVTHNTADAQAGLGFTESDLGTGNRLSLPDDQILANLNDVQFRNGLPPSASLDSGDFTVEMETGTGKTYVYLRTIFEQIEVASATVEDAHNKPYVRLVSTRNQRGTISAKIELDVETAAGVRRREVTVQDGDDFEQITKRAIYQDCRIGEIRVEKGNEFVELRVPGDERFLRLGESYGDVDALAVQREMIRRTIREHFDKEKRLRPQGIKVCVNQEGQRLHGFEINTLTVIATESYEEFAENLQQEIEADTGIRFGVVEEHQFAAIPVVGIDGQTKALGSEASKNLWEHLKAEGYIDATGRVQDTHRHRPSRSRGNRTRGGGNRGARRGRCRATRCAHRASGPHTTHAPQHPPHPLGERTPR